MFEHCSRVVVNGYRAHVGLAQIGMVLMGLGLGFMTLGVMFFFDRALLAMGNLLFLGSFPLLIGVKKTLNLFNPLVRGAKRVGIATFLGGVLLVLIGWPFVGICVEGCVGCRYAGRSGGLSLTCALRRYGAFKMFGGILPRIIGVLSGLPVVGRLLQLPIVNKVVGKVTKAAGPDKTDAGVV